ncbi:ras-associated and pleckstrin homology domains-containing protein 1a isoform X2 [Parambassis ranga]|uniref:Ras-associated and pleckstrin homology domains-containing protein 1a isoform X2 n=1 Tax=Parambassis ranga TaxID=210632 RepID=A0A6P7HEH0_9TELE|nr:ras-associated and pleckstrin homology domains-containing protein 1-like isoform X2 [Parambassis ranga]
MDQLSDEEVEVREEEEDEEEDSDKEDQDLDKMFGAWLGELDKLTQSLDDGRPEPPPQQKAPLRQETNMANFSYRFSIYNINEALNQGENVDLDALMADLCSIEQELSTINAKPNSAGSMARLGLTDTKVRQKPPVGRSSRQQAAGGSGGGSSNSVSGGGGSSGTSSNSSSTRASPAGTIRAPTGHHGRPALASNFSLDDITAQLEKASLSMDEAGRQSSSHSLSSASSCTSATMRRPGSSQRQHRRTGSVGTVSEHEVRSFVHSSRSSVTSASGVSVNSASSMDSLDSVLRSDSDNQQQLSVAPSAEGAAHGHHNTEEEQAAKLKAENIRVALEKIKEAQVKKLVIRVHLSDESSKTMMVDERQTVRQVLDSLLEKSHCGYSPDWSLVETINELQMERIFEDHENLVENLLNWTRDSQNRLMFTERIEKYALFKNPQNYLLGRKETCEMAERNKEALLEECFGGSSVSVPEMEGVLWLKEDGKKSWKKRYFLLRASGIYYVPKGKAKASRDLVCFLQLDHVNVYLGQDYKSKYKAPTDYCMVLKHPQIQKKSQYIKYLCCDDVRTLQQWINSIRIAKYGKQLYINFQEAMRRTEAAYDWSSLSSSSIKSGSSSSSLPESQSNHSSQSDSGVSEMTSSSHTRSQSVVSSIFSDAWRRGTQGEMMKIDPISRPIPLQIPTLSPVPPSQTPPSRTSYTDGLVQSEDSSPSPPSPPPPPPPPPVASVAHQPTPTSSYIKYSTLARLQSQSQSQSQSQPRTQQAGAPPPQSTKTNYNTLPAAYSTSPPLPPSPPPPPPPTVPAPGSAMAALKFGPSSPSALPPPPPPDEEDDHSYLPPPPPESLETNGLPLPPSQEPSSCPQLSNAGLQQFLAQKFPNMVYDFTPAVSEDSPPPPPPAELSPPNSLQVLRPLSPNAPPPAPPKTFTGGFPPQTAPKPSGPSSLPLALSPVSPTPQTGHGSFKKQQSFSTGHSPNQPPPTLPKQHSLSSKNLAISPSASSASVSIAAATSSLVKQIVNQFPGNSAPSSLPASNSMEGAKFTAPQSPPAVKAKPKWQPGSVAAPQSPEFPPPPPDNSLGEFPPPPSSSSSKTGSPIKKSPSTSSTGSTKRGPPPTPQRASSIRSNSTGETQDERPKKVESLVSKFGQGPQTGTSSSSSSATGSPSKESSALPTPLPKPGKLNLANLPLALQGLQTGQHHQPSEFPSPPPPPPPSQPPHLDLSLDYFPPPPSDFELFPPPPHPSEFHHPPKVAVVNPQPQMQVPQQPPTSLISSSWKQGSLKKGAVPPPSLNRRTSNTAQYDNTPSLPLSPPPLSQTPPPSLTSYSSSSSPVPPTSPKLAGPVSLALKPHFLEDLNRTLKRKSVSRHGSLTSSHLISSSKMEPMGTMDDMALLPPPPPELMQQQQQGIRGHSHTLSRHHTHSHSTKHANISGYATLRRGPPPAPPKRDQSTKLTSEW